ncbi:hypothetical protein VTL71DRAFT_12828 [Oculimacula yallundae]|uniref:Pentatricopeptide repeat-containing protein n=1 Tax=Oculimacula yallundae TaxID=86028 RepID=A0ABR4CPD9_9HELO
MPPRLDLLTQRWSTFDLPILPFLAPRVFTPWPRSVRRSHTGTKAPAKSEPPRYVWDDGDDLPQKAFDVPSESRKRDQIHESSTQQPPSLQHGRSRPRGAKPPSKSPLDIDGGVKKTAKSHKQDDFWSKYEEIWGPTKKKEKKDRSLQKSVLPTNTSENGKEGTDLVPPNSSTKFGRVSPRSTEHSMSFEDGLRVLAPRNSALEHGAIDSKQAYGEEWFAQPKVRRVQQHKGDLTTSKHKEYIALPKLERIRQQRKLWMDSKRNETKEKWVALPKVERIREQRKLWIASKSEDRAKEEQPGSLEAGRKLWVASKGRESVAEDGKQTTKYTWSTLPMSESIQQQRSLWMSSEHEDGAKKHTLEGLSGVHRPRRDRRRFYQRSKVLTSEKIRQRQMLLMHPKRVERHFKSQSEARGLSKVRLKFVRLAPEGKFGHYNFSASWNWRFAMLNARYDKAMKGRVRPRVLSYTNPRVPKAFAKELVEDKSLEQIRESWTNMPPSRRRKLWPEVMLTTLEDYPNQALDVLQATFMPPYPAGYAVSDSLDYIMSHVDDKRILHKENFLVALSKAITFFLTKGPTEHVHLSQRALYRLVRSICSDDQSSTSKTSRLLKHYKKGFVIRCIYQTLVQVGHPMHENTLLQFASALAKEGRVQLACEILQRLKDDGTDFNSPKILSLCSTLLYRVHRQSLHGGAEPSITATDIFRFVLEAGAEPNIITYNLLLKSSLDVGDHQTAWQMHDMMIANGPIPDAHTYSTLLNDAKLRIDPIAIKAVMDHVNKSGIRSQYIATDILHAILLLHKQERRAAKESGVPLKPQEPLFNRLLQVYYDYFNIGPLAQIIPIFAEKYPKLMEEPVNGTQEYLQDPPAPALVVMITGWLDNLQTSYPAKLFYDHFRSLLAQNDPVVAELTKTTHVWNIVLGSLSKFGQLADCSNLVGDMLAVSDHNSAPSPSTESNEAIQAEQEEIFSPASTVSTSPNEESPKPLAVENAATEADDIPQPLPQESSNSSSSFDSTSIPTPPILTPPKPDVYTWTILLKAFMDQHQPRAAEKVLLMMRERGIQPNQVTWNTLVLGYARMDDTAMTVDGLRRLERAGLSADEFTMNALALVKNRKALVEAMARKDLENAGEEGAAGKEVEGGLHKVADEEALKKKEPGLEELWRIDGLEHDTLDNEADHTVDVR